MNRLKIAQRELRSLRSDVLLEGLIDPLKVQALGHITFALASLQAAEMCLSGMPTPLTILENLEKMARGDKWTG